MKYVLIPIIFFVCISCKNDEINNCDFTKMNEFKFIHDSISFFYPKDVTLSSSRVFSESIFFDTLLHNTDTSNYLRVVGYYEFIVNRTDYDLLNKLDGVHDSYYKKDSTIKKEVIRINQTDVGVLLCKSTSMDKFTYYNYITFF
jgi:hypothetical protein